jgi:hypothetical protein
MTGYRRVGAGALPVAHENRCACGFAVLLLPVVMVACSTVAGAELRVKSFVSRSWLEADDVQARLHDSSPITGDTEVRFMADAGHRGWSATWHHTVTWQGGDDVAFARLFETVPGSDGLRQRVNDDDRRLFDLAGHIDQGSRHDLVHGVERLNATWRGGDWSVTVGRQAQSLGGGILFHPMDFLSPFSPTAVDRDYKAGEDMMQVHRQFDGGGEMSLLAVGRRDEDHDVTRAAASFAIRGRGQFGAVEVESIVAEHGDDLTGALGLRIPLGGALLRTDVVAAREDGAEFRISGVINADYSFTVADKLVYTFAEYYHNGFGVRSLDPGKPLPEALEIRVARGEVYALMRDYLGFGGSIQWHPLATQSLSLVRNLDDGSMFLQGGLQFDLSDHQNLEAGVLLLIGDPGDEFGGKPVAIDGAGRLVTAGTGVRAYLRWTWFPRLAGLNRN